MMGKKIMFCTFQIGLRKDVSPTMNQVFGSAAYSAIRGQKGVWKHVCRGWCQVACTENIQAAHRCLLSSVAAHAYILSTRGHKTVFAEALVWAECVHTASVLAGASAWARLRTFVNVWKTQTIFSEYKPRNRTRNSQPKCKRCTVTCKSIKHV